ncbi:MAG: porin [Thiobacillus sp.]|uniref:porin n=1 Tax=Thiobacillus sp. TaxID=924 RepID=UPI00168C4DEF|nr:porin [Thiobacillus sp.]QLQ02888.1 MAG: porin [Thiobacillus sp.]
MQKKLIALALASAFAAPAFAATSNVDISGQMNLSVDYLDSDNAANGGNVGVSSNASNIIFKGSEDLGGGLNAIWQIQTYFSAGGTGNSDTFNGSAQDGVGSGNTFVGLNGGFGTVIVGKNESPVKMLSRKTDFFDTQIGNSSNLTSVDTAGLGFDTRPNNQVAYTTPSMSGLSGTVAYFSAMSGVDATDAAVDGWAAAGNYENGPLMLGLGYEKHNLSNANALLSDEKVWRLAAGYAIGNFKFTGLYQKANDIAGVNSADRKVWGLGAGYNMGNILLKAQYYEAGDLNSVSNTGAQLYAVGVDYSLSKRTKLQFAYAATDNDSGAAFSAFGGGHGDNPGTSAGGNPTGFSMGVVHNF